MKAQKQINKNEDPFAGFQLQRRWLSLQKEREEGCVRIPSNLVAIIKIPFGQILTLINATGGSASSHKALRCLALLKTV